MSPIITDMPINDFPMRRATTIETIQNNPVSTYSSSFFERTYFMLTDHDFNFSHPTFITYTELDRDNLLDSKTIGTINISNLLFGNSRALEGKELEVLNKTYKRLLSKVPTKL